MLGKNAVCSNYKESLDTVCLSTFNTIQEPNLNHSVFVVDAKTLSGLAVALCSYRSIPTTNDSTSINKLVFHSSKIKYNNERNPANGRVPTNSLDVKKCT